MKAVHTFEAECNGVTVKVEVRKPEHSLEESRGITAQLAVVMPGQADLILMSAGPVDGDRVLVFPGFIDNHKPDTERGCCYQKPNKRSLLKAIIAGYQQLEVLAQCYDCPPPTHTGEDPVCVSKAPPVKVDGRADMIPFHLGQHIARLKRKIEVAPTHDVEAVLKQELRDLEALLSPTT